MTGRIFLRSCRIYPYYAESNVFHGTMVILVAALLAAVLVAGCGAAGDTSVSTPTGAPPPAETNEAGAVQGAGPPQGGEAPAGAVPGAALGEADAAASPAPVAGTGRETPEPEGSEKSPVILPAAVTWVVDGDTVQVRLKDGREEKVRFIGVDTPESTREVEPYGKEAAAYTKSRLDGRKVYLEPDVGERDKYGRLLAYVWLEPPTDDSEAEVRAKMFNAELLLVGMAQVMTVPPNVKYADMFVKFQQEAREAGKGLWAAGVGKVAPYEKAR